MRQQRTLNFRQRDAWIEIGRLVHHDFHVRIFLGSLLDGVFPIGEQVGADEAADRCHRAGAGAGREGGVDSLVEVRRTLHGQRRGEARRVVRIATHRDIDRDDRLAGRLEQAVVKTAAGLRRGRTEQIAVEAFGDGVLDHLGLRCRTEIRIEDLELEAVFGGGRFEPGKPRKTIRIVDAFGQVSDAIFLARLGARLVVIDDGLRSRRHFDRRGFVSGRRDKRRADRGRCKQERRAVPSECCNTIDHHKPLC